MKPAHHTFRSALFFMALLIGASSVWAGPAKITTFSPQGEVSQVRQLAVRFNQAMVPMGDPNAAAPLALECNPADILKNGQGRWVDEKNWVFDFQNNLPPGVLCTAKVNEGLKSVAGEMYSGQVQYNFNTGGPFVKNVLPWEYSVITEDQAFALQLNGDATAASIAKSVVCESDAIGEQIPVKIIEGADRDAILNRVGWQEAAKSQPGAYWVVQCQQRLTPKEPARLVYGTGVATPTGIENHVTKTFNFNVRAPFMAEFTCTRENAQAACMPLAAMRLMFNAPLPITLAEKITLQTVDGSATFKPIISREERNLGATTNLSFTAPVPENTAFKIVLPQGIVDDTGRPLANADQFPLSVATAPMPALAKFAASPFGIIELHASPDTPPMMPLTVRRIETALDIKDQALLANLGSLAQLRLTSDVDIIRWLRAIDAFDSNSAWDSISLARARALMPQAVLPRSDSDWVRTREISLLARQSSAQLIELPADEPVAQTSDASAGEATETADMSEESGTAVRPFEVIGIPLKEPGYHVLEVASPALGAALLGENGRNVYIRTGVLVTNLGVHAKIGRENSLVWVTRLDDGKPVAGADVQVSGCDTTVYFTGKTDENGIVNIDKPLPDGQCHDNWESFLFISARAMDDKAAGGMDMAFTLSTWNRGIESWRFSYPTSRNPNPSTIATTVFDRTLLRAGETVSMKHFIRNLTLTGFTLPDGPLPNTLSIVHQGSGQETKLPLSWNRTGGGLSAQSVFQIPAEAKLGTYTVELLYTEGDRSLDSYSTGSFQVEEFRLPVFEGSISVSSAGTGDALVQPKEIPLGLQVNYLSGGGAALLPVQVSAVVRNASVDFSAYSNRFSFTVPVPREPRVLIDEDDYWEEDSPADYAPAAQKLIADKVALTLDRNGAGTLTLKSIPPVTGPQNLLIEASFADPNGEIVTLRRNENLWPAAVVAGIRNDDWVAIRDSNIPLQAIALSTDGKPLAGVPLEIRAQQRLVTTTRKRLVGGFYMYDSNVEIKDMGVVCSGTSDAQGLLSCQYKFGLTPEQLATCAQISGQSGPATASVLASCKPTEGGEIELIATAKDSEGRSASASTTLWIVGRDELWFGGSDSDRIDLLPEQLNYRPGDIARFQVRMPFREATALVTVEREGIIESHLMTLRGDNPTIELKVGENWGPNVYVSALVLRGRLREVPLYSFFEWGYQNADQWWQAFQGNMDYAPPTAMVDLSKPAYRLGVTEIRVIDPAFELDVNVAPEKAVYQVRDTAKATITVKLPDGTPAANADVALAVVDEALLELKRNTSWDLLAAMLRERSWGVYTATAQMEIIGRRHYGRKALPAGGGGGGGSARELFDTLLVWNPSVKLDANGQAVVNIPLNDSLTTFRIVAIAAQGSSRFGSGNAKIRSTQDLQLISGLPPVVRSDDKYRATITVRNTTDAAMSVQVSAKATGLTLPELTLDIPANAAREAVWEVAVPAQLAGMHEGQMAWEISAQDKTHGAKDSIRITQRVLTGVPITVRQATLKQLDGTLELPVAAPSDGLPGRGGIQVSMVPRLAEGLPAIDEWFRTYPYMVSLEAQLSVALGTRDENAMKALSAHIPAYLDEDGLAYYYPPSRSISHDGSDTLTAYILASADEASKLNSKLALPAGVANTMLSGLTRFVEGKIQRDNWSPRQDRDLRRLAAMEALSRYGRFQPRMLGAITIAPNQWPTTSVIDWLQILQRTPDIDSRSALMDEAEQILRSRLNVAGTRLGFSTEDDDYWWWLMWNIDLNAARLVLATINSADWQEDLPKIVNGFIARQQSGVWHTTTSNLWGGFALEQFSRKFENIPIQGTTQVRMVDARGGTLSSGTIDWNKVQRLQGREIGTNAPGSLATFGAPTSAAGFENNAVFLNWPNPPVQTTVMLTQKGSGRPWATIQSLAAVPLNAPFSAGYSVTKTITPINEQVKGQVTRGDIWRVHIEVKAQTDMTWIAVNDPIPGGATILGSGLGRDSEIAANTPTPSSAGDSSDNGWRAWLSYQERAQDAFRAYYQYVPKGSFSIEYTVRLNNVGTFLLPPTRVEALYAPEMFGETPNATVTVKPASGTP